MWSFFVTHWWIKIGAPLTDKKAERINWHRSMLYISVKSEQSRLPAEWRGCLGPCWWWCHRLDTPWQKVHTNTYTDIHTDTQTHAQIDIQTDRHKYTHTRKHAHFCTQANIDVDDVDALVLAGHSRDKRSTQGLCLEAHPYSAFDPLSEARTHTAAGFSSKHTTVYHIPETEYNGPRRLSVVATVSVSSASGDYRAPCWGPRGSEEAVFSMYNRPTCIYTCTVFHL